MVVSGLVRPGHALPRHVGPGEPDAGRLLPRPVRPRPASTSGSASATYWHNGYVYVADYTRGIDVLKFNGQITGTPQDGICWGGCDGAKVTYTGTADGSAGGTVPATLSLTLGHAGELRHVHAGHRQDVRRHGDRERDLDGRRRAAERGRPVEHRDRPPGQRDVLPAGAADGSGAQRGQPGHGVQQRRLLGQPAEPADLQRRRSPTTRCRWTSASTSARASRSVPAPTARR